MNEFHSENVKIICRSEQNIFNVFCMYLQIHRLLHVYIGLPISIPLNRHQAVLHHMQMIT